jgi:hypothetical protein
MVFGVTRSIAIDLHGCQRRRLEDPNSIRAFEPSVIDAIGMRAHGPLRLERFGNGELEGWSAMQFIETSSITIHADDSLAGASSTCSPAGGSTRRSRRRSRSPTSAVDAR